MVKTKHYYVFAISILLASLHLNVVAQERGKVLIKCNAIDSASEAGIPGASIFVYAKMQDKVIGSFITDSSGSCTILIDTFPQAGISFELYSVGYKKKRVDILYKGNTFLERISLVPDADELKNVTVKSTSPVTFDNNILRYNLSSVPHYEHMTVMDILNYLPYFWVDDNNVVKMMGQPLTILINNKPHPFYNNSQNLNSLPPQAIEKIEVNIVPTARNGSQKVMNITLKTNYFLGWAGNFSVGVNPLSVGPSGSLSYWGNKFGCTLSGNYRYAKTNSNGSSISESLQNANQFISINQSRNAQNKVSSGSFVATAFYNIDSFNVIDLLWAGFPNSNNTITDGLVHYEDANGTTTTKQSRSDNTLTNNGNTIGLNYTHKFRKPRKEFYILSQFNIGPSNNKYDIKLYDQNVMPNVLESDQLTTSMNKLEEATIEAILQNNSNDKIKYTIGSKLINRWSNMRFDSKYYSPSADTFVTGNFKYLQTVSTTYADVNIRLKKKLTLSAGGRFEAANLTTTQQTMIRESFTNFIPTISLTYNANNFNLFSISYTRTIQRPGFNSLTSFSIISNAYFRDSGNVNLRPQSRHNIGLQYFGNSGNLRYGAGVTYSVTNNFIDDFFTTGPDGAIVRTSANSVNKAWSVSADIEFPITKRIRLSHFSSGTIVTQTGQGYNNNQLSGYVEEKLFYTLSKMQRLSLLTRAFSPNLTLQGKDQIMDYWSTIISYSYFFNLRQNPAQLGITLDNIWLTNGLPSYREQKGPTFYYYNKTYTANRFVNLSFVINFKGKQYRNSSFSRSKSIQNNDIKSRE